MTASGGDTFTATIPGAAAGHLIRYRVEATNAVTHQPLAPGRRHHRSTRASSSPDGITSAIPVLEWFIADADYNAITSNPTADIDRHGGARLQRHRLRQRAGQHPGPGLADRAEAELEVRDGRRTTTSTCPACWSSRSTSSPCRPTAATSRHGRPLLAWDSYQRAGVVNTQMFPVRTQRNGAVPGPLHLPRPVRRHLARPRGLRRRPVLQGRHGAFDATRPLDEYRFEKKNPADGDFAPLQAFLNGVDLTGTAAAQLPAGQRRHPADDQLRGRHGDRRSTSTRRRRTSTSARTPTPAAGRSSRGTSTTRSATAAATSTATS